MTANAGSSGPAAAGTGAAVGTTDVPPVALRPSTDFANLVARELSLTEEEAKGARGRRWLEQPPRSLFGIALSGGGIRSATFNLGLMQGLNEVGLLRGMDYLSTVSGGGYVGGFWTRWRHRHGGPGNVRSDAMFPGLAQIGPTGLEPNQALTSGDEPAEIRHLRKFSKFLAPNLGVFTFDTGRMLVAVANAAVPSLIGAASFLLGTLLLSIVIGWLVLVFPRELVAPGTAGPLHFGAAFAMFLFGALHLLAMHWAWRPRPKLTAQRVWVVAVVLGALAATWGLMVGNGWPASVTPTLARDWFTRIGNRDLPQPTDAIWGYMLSPALALLLVSALNALLRPRVAERPGQFLADVREEADRSASWLMFASAAWLVVVLLWWVAFFIAANRTSLGAAVGSLAIGGVPVASLATWLSRFVARPSHDGERMAQRAGRLSIVAIGYLAVAALVVAAMLTIIWAHEERAWPVLLELTAIGLLVTLLFYDANRIGLHEFYRARIVRGFLGAATVKGIPEHDDATAPTAGDDEYLHVLTRSRPLHLVVCAANDLTPGNAIASFGRGAASAVLSPIGFSVGEDWVTWPTATDRPLDAEAAPTLGAAITASGAAFNTQMGAKSKSLGPAIGFLMTSLGLRLGLWLRHPARLAASLSAGPKTGAPLRVVRGGAGIGFFSELLGMSDAQNGDWVFLSDGGHFDNTGLYELVRRHCRFIIVSDCGQDTDRAFDDLGNAVRRVREDFDVDIRINLEPLKPNANGFSGQPMIAGDIHYPEGDTGTLLVFKPSIVGTEPPDILQYRARNANFPHQSTGDQFFDEAQWESYRRLGQHVARIAFASTSERDRHPTLAGYRGQLQDIDDLEELRDEMAKIFSTARREWFARPADYAQRVERLARQVTALDQVLDARAPRLVHEVSWELGAQSPPRPGSGAGAPPVPPLAGLPREKVTEVMTAALAEAALAGNTATPAAERAAAVVAALEGAARGARLMSVEECARSIGAIRQALVTFEAIFLSENLATQFNQPMYAGVMNLMARWMRAPLVRTWWPLLKATCTQGFRQFAEAQFDLNTARAVLTSQDVAPGPDVLTLASRFRPENPAETPEVHLLMHIADADVTADDARAPAASVEVARLDASRKKGGSLLVWLARDLVVPPGLWGTGLGTYLLHRMGEHIEKGKEKDWISIDGRSAYEFGQVVLVRTFRAAGANAKKDAADLQQLYLGEDFEPIAPADLKALYEEDFKDAYTAMHARWHEREPVLPDIDTLMKGGVDNFVLLHRPAGKPTPTVAVPVPGVPAGG